MGMVLTVDSPEFLDVVNYLIHDCFFDIDHISFDATEGVLSVPFSFELTAKVPRQDSHTAPGTLRKAVARWLRLPPSTPRTHVQSLPAMLRIEQVRDYSLIDTEGVGRYDFNKLSYDPSSGVIRVLTGIPLHFTVQVRSLAIGVVIGSEQS